MSRSFNGSTDYVTFSAGAANIVQGPITMAALVRATSVTGERPIFAGVGAGFGYLLLVNDGQILVNDYFGSGPTIATGNWYWVVATKAAGNATPRFHVRQIGGSWTHADGNAAASDDTDVASSIYVGYDGSGHWSGNIAATAIWDSVLTDLAIEAACTLAASDLKAATPKWMTRWNQASTGTSVTDDMTGGGNQSAITGTTVDSVNEPAGWSYSLSGGSFSSSATSALTFGVTATGQVGKVATATLAATASTTATGAATAGKTATLATTATVTASGSSNLTRSSSLPLNATITASGVVEKVASASLAATAATTASGAVAAPGGATLPLTAAISAVGVRGATADATTSLAVGIAASGSVGRSASANLSAALGITAIGGIDLYVPPVPPADIELRVVHSVALNVDHEVRLVWQP